MLAAGEPEEHFGLISRLGGGVKRRMSCKAKDSEKEVAGVYRRGVELCLNFGKRPEIGQKTDNTGAKRSSGKFPAEQPLL